MRTFRHADPRVQRGSPFGEASWSDQVIRNLELESTLRPQGCPKKRSDEEKNGS